MAMAMFTDLHLLAPLSVKIVKTSDQRFTLENFLSSQYVKLNEIRGSLPFHNIMLINSPSELLKCCMTFVGTGILLLSRQHIY